MLAPLGGACERVQFSAALSEREYKSIARLLSAYPSVTLRVYMDYKRTIQDLEFLRHFPWLRGFEVDIWHLESIDGLTHLSPELSYLGIGATRKTFSMAVLERFRSLRELALEGQLNGIGTISQLRGLEQLTLRSITLPDLAILVPLRRLWSLDIKLGGTKNLELLPIVGPLKYLELWMIKGLDDIGSISRIHTLQYLFLQSLKRVTDLPDFSRLPNLRRVHLETMKGLTDICKLAAAPALEELEVLDMPQLSIEAFSCLIGHPALRAGCIALGSQRKNDKLRQTFSYLQPSRLGKFRFR
jgi:internalin A